MEQELKSLRYKSRFGKVCIFICLLASLKNDISPFCFRGKAYPTKGLGRNQIVLKLLR